MRLRKPRWLRYSGTVLLLDAVDKILFLDGAGLTSVSVYKAPVVQCGHLVAEVRVGIRQAYFEDEWAGSGVLKVEDFLFRQPPPTLGATRTLGSRS